MGKLTVRDGHSGDGVDTQTLTFEYENGRYDRLERDFYGFAKVTTKMLDENDVVYRQVIRTFKNDSFYTKMRPERELVTDGAGRKYTENVNHYRLLDVDTQTELIEVYPYSATATVFPQLTKAESFFYEGEETAGMMTYQTFEYDAYGNVTRYFDSGNPGAEDDVEDSCGL